MTRKNLKKYIRFSIVLIFIILIVVLIRAIILNFIGKEKIMNRLILGLNNLNFAYTSNDGETEVYVYGKYEKRINSKETIYNDYENKITRVIYQDSTYMDEYSNNGYTDMDYYKQFIDDYFNNDYYDYKYIGKKKIKDVKCTVVRFLGASKAYEIYIWIDDSTNLVKKIEKYFLDKSYSNKKEKILDQDWDFNTGSGNVDDIKITEEILSTHTTETNG